MTLTQLLGSWDLISYKTLNPETTEEARLDAIGRLHYTNDNLVFVIIANSTTSVSYCGTFVFDTSKMQVVHRVEASNILNYIGSDLIRSVRLLDGGVRIELQTVQLIKGRHHFLEWKKKTG